MNKTELSTYHQIFYNEYKKNNNTINEYSICGHLIFDSLNINKLKSAIKSTTLCMSLLKCRISKADTGLFFIKNKNTCKIKYFENIISKKQIISCISESISDGELCFFIVIKNKKSYKLIFVIHNVLLINDQFQKLVPLNILSFYYYKKDFEKISKLVNYQINQNMIHSNIKQSEKFWYKNVISLETPNLKFLQQDNRFISLNKIKEIKFDFSEEISKKVNTVSNYYKISPLLFGQIIFAFLISRYSGQKKIGICSNVRFKYQDTGDYLTNPYVLPFDFESITSFKDIVCKLRKFLKQLVNSDKYDHRYFPIYKLVNENKLEFFKVFFVEIDEDEIQNLHYFKNRVISENYTTYFNSELFVEHSIISKSINITIKYNMAYINDVLLSNFINCYKRLYEEIVFDLFDSKDISLYEYSILDNQEYNKIIYEWNKTKNSLLPIKTMHELFEEQVEKTPDNIALVFEDNVWTYSELNHRSNQLAHYLQRNYNIKEDDLILLCLDRSELMLIAIIGILKSGGAYVPIDVNSSVEQATHFAKDTSSKLVLTIQKYLNLFISINHLLLDDYKTQNKLKEQPLFNAKSNVNYSNLVYVMYTSGTTGVPKGIMMEHKAVVPRILSMIQHSSINHHSRYLFKTNYTFDVSFSDIFTTLTVGASLYLTKNVFDIEEICSLIKKYKITICHFVPSQLDFLTDEFIEKGLFKYIKTVNVSGEKFDKFKAYKYTKYVNYYGPTETGEISADIYDFKNSKVLHQTISTIGYHLSFSKIYILDDDLTPLPIGSIGEIYIGGDGIARGYLNNSKLNSNKFILNPFQSLYEKKYNKNFKLYKTGDLARFLSDGNIEFIGRNDNQIKVNGHRVELSAIESILLGHKGVKQVCAIFDTRIQRILVYYTCSVKINHIDVSKWLHEQTPKYIHPIFLTFVKNFPLTIHGKVDIKKLSELKLKTNNAYIPPQNVLEANVCNIYADVLKLDKQKVGLNDNFFYSGGNSIIAIKIAHELRNKYSIKIDPIIILRYPKIKDVIKYVQLSDTNQHKVILKSTNENEYKLSFAQERIWFVSKEFLGKIAYNIPLIYKLNSKCNIEILISCLKLLIKRHKIFNTIIQEDVLGNTKLQSIEHEIDIKIKKVFNKKELDFNLREEIKYAFNLKEELPIKISLYTLNNQYLISIIIHHIVFDGWSQEIFLRDLISYYNYLSQTDKNDHLLNLINLEIEYKDFAVWQRKILTSSFIDNQLIYWKNKLKNLENLNLPTDYKRPLLFDYLGKTIECKITQLLSRELRLCAKELNISLFSLMLSAYYILLGAYSNQKDIVIGSVVSNRHYKNIENIIGFFVNTVVLRQQINTENNVIHFIKNVFKETIDIHLNQDVPFETLIDKLNLERDRSRHPIFQCLFILQNFDIYAQKLFRNYKFPDMNQTAKFDLSWIIDDSKEQLICNIEFATSLFKLDTIKNYFHTYEIILQQLVNIIKQKSTKVKLKNLYFVDQKTHKHLVSDYNNVKPYPSDKNIPIIFREQVLKTPNNIAIVYENKKLSYKDLDIYSDNFAFYLKNNYKVRSNNLVAIFIDKSEYIIICMLAILKLGAAYISIDKHLPVKRIKAILKNAAPVLLITNCNDTYNYLQEFYDAISIPLLLLKSFLFEINAAHFYLNKNIDSNKLATVIYTSGTTGEPKGVMIKHKNIVSLAKGSYFINLTSKDRIIQLADLSFDASIFEIWCTILNGATLYLSGNKTDLLSNPSELEQFINREKISALWLTKTLFDHIYAQNMFIFKKLKYLLIGGEALNLGLIKKLVNSDYRPQYILNCYGPTENTVFSTTYKVTKRNIMNSISVPIGKPLKNRFVYILDSDLRVLPIGAVGELYLSGEGISNGYHSNKKLTQNNFLINPYNNIFRKGQTINQLIYKTGDLGRFLQDGNIQYIGRNDSQIKIRGYRVELEEIENIINSHPNVEQSIVVAMYNKNNEKYLIGYYVGKLIKTESETQNLINSWNKIYEEEYSKLKNNLFIGWNSSYNNLPIPKNEMIEWLNSTVDTILKLNPKHILEVGSGSGLLISKLIQQCDKYYAFDFSNYAIENNKKIVAALNNAHKFTGIVSKAHEIDFKKLYGLFDTVIINSVVQYFPNLEYLEDILLNLINNFNKDGCIFIGDVRNYDLFDSYIYSVLKYKNKTIDIGTIEYYKNQENELLISPKYFLYLKKKLKHITYIEILPKISNANNEMSCYRYDVVLHISKKNINSTVQLVNTDEFQLLYNVQEEIKFLKDKRSYFKYPNKEIIYEYIQTKHMYGYRLDLDLAKFNNLITIKQLIELLKDCGYSVTYFLNVLDPLYINLIIDKNVTDEKIEIFYNTHTIDNVPQFSNNPLKIMIDINFSQTLKDFLKNYLPDYMNPQMLISVEKIPMLPNGKVDYKLLPYTEFEIDKTFEAPSSEIEIGLCKIFADILNIQENNISVTSNFFHLGGNSLLVLKLVSKINLYFNCNIKVADVFTKNTIRDLAKHIKTPHLNLVTNLNNTFDKPNIFMIHPGMSGVEVYYKLAYDLSENFSCYGIDNYNIYNKSKITDINLLSDFYLKLINNKRLETNRENEPYIILGWSLGGQIALNIAYILEQNGIKNIKLILIDSIYFDKNFDRYITKFILDSKQLENFVSRYKKVNEYNENIKKSWECDMMLARQYIPIQLKNTNILFFKAVNHVDQNFFDESFKEKNIINVNYNNINKITYLENINLINIPDSNHYNILDYHNLISSNILNTLKTET